MKKRKWLSMVCIVFGILLLLLVGLIATVGIEDSIIDSLNDFEVQYISTDGCHEDIEYPVTQAALAQHSRGDASIFLNIPKGWEYEAEDKDGSNDFCIAFWPSGHSEGKIKAWYYEAFGVCGTGLEQEKITLGTYEAYKGTYDNKNVWDFISLEGTSGQFVVMNEGADAWWDEYGDEAMQILGTIKVEGGD